MMDLIIKIMVELLSVLALTTKQIRQGRFSEYTDQIYVGLCSMCRREIREEVVRETEGQDTGCPGSIGSIDEGRRTVGCCTDLGYRPPRIKRNKQDETFVISPPLRCRDRRYSVGDRLEKDVQHWLSPPDPSTNQNFVSKLRHEGTTEWFFESSALTAWKAKGSLLWIHGKRRSFELPMSVSY